MQLWAISYEPSSFTDEVSSKVLPIKYILNNALEAYEKGLSLLDTQSRDKIRRFYHRSDACRCLLGRLLPRMLLKAHGFSLDSISFGLTENGKPFIASAELRSEGFY